MYEPKFCERLGFNSYVHLEDIPESVPYNGTRTDFKHQTFLKSFAQKISVG